jgi:hypothetical protein
MPLDRLLIAAYHTGGPYAWEAVELRQTLEYFDLEYEIVELTSRRDWRANAHLRPLVLADLRRRFPDRPLLSLDVDARVRSDPRPVLDACQGDIAFHTFVHPNGRAEPLPGTLFLRPREPTDRLLVRWAELNEQAPRLNDRQNFAAAVDDCTRTGLVVDDLPVKMTFIYDTHARLYPHIKPVIEQMQASRRTRQEVAAE